MSLFPSHIKTFVPRPYQAEAISKAVDFYQDDKKEHAIEILPTGSGKSVVIAGIASKLEGRTIVFQPSKEILEQNVAKFTSYGYRAGVYSASAGMKQLDRVTFATIGSVARKHHLFKQFQNIIIDECFPYEQYISTENGKMKIGALVNRFAAGMSIPRVISYNESTKKVEPKEVVAVSCTSGKQLLELQFSKNVVVKTTANHPFLTSFGWLKASELNTGDTVLCTKPNGTYALIPNRDQEDFLLGSLLGDGSVDKSRKIQNINRFRFIQGEDQKEYLFWKAELFQCVPSEVAKNGFAGKKAYRFTTKVLCIDNAKCTKRYAIETLNTRSLAISWMDDGHLATLQNCGTLYAVADSLELTSLLCEKLKMFGITGIVKTDKSSLSGKPFYYINFNKESVEKISELIAKYVHPSMAYKVVTRYRDQVGSYGWDNQYQERGAVVFLGKRLLETKEVVYNIQVQDNETYVITSTRFSRFNNDPLDGIIVHNCHLTNAKGGMYNDFIESLSHAKVLGLTATPYRLTATMEGAMLKFLTRTRPRIFSKVLYYVQNDVLFNAGHLSKLEYFSFDVINRAELQTNSTGTDFNEASLRHHYEKINFVDTTVGYAYRLLQKRRNLLVFCALVAEAHKVSRKIPGSVVLTGETDKATREKYLSQFKQGIIRCVVNVGVLTTGFDFPELEVVLIARSTMSLALYYQIVGRVMRPHPNKPSGWVVDLGGNVKFFGKIETMKIQQNEKGLYSIWNNGRCLTNVPFQKM